MKLGLTPEQVALRRQGIGGSDAGRIMSGDWRALWREKTGLAESEDLSSNLAVQMGSATENFNAYWFTKVTGRLVAERGARVQNTRHPFMVANLDGITTTSKGLGAYWDAKHVGRLDEQTVLRYTPQMVHCCAVLDLDWWVLSVFVGNSKHEVVEQPVEPFYTASLIAKEREFWGYVERDEEPPEQGERVLAPKPQPKLRTVLLNELTPGGTDWPNWAGTFIHLAHDLAGTETARIKNAIVRKEMAALIPEDVGLVRFGLVEAKRDGRGLSLSMKRRPDDSADDR